MRSDRFYVMQGDERCNSRSGGGGVVTQGVAKGCDKVPGTLACNSVKFRAESVHVEDSFGYGGSLNAAKGTRDVKTVMNYLG